jgi:hypothetical protein
LSNNITIGATNYGEAIYNAGAFLERFNKSCSHTRQTNRERLGV